MGTRTIGGMSIITDAEQGQLAALELHTSEAGSEKTSVHLHKLIGNYPTFTPAGRQRGVILPNQNERPEDQVSNTCRMSA